MARFPRIVVPGVPHLDIWTYCPMPNHVHLIVVPSSKQGLARPLGEAHHRPA